MTTDPDPPISPHARLALGIALADVQYVFGALMRPADTIGKALFVQWGLMTSYEAQRHVAAALGSEFSPVWDPDMAKSARMAGKFFDDRKRTIEDLADYFRRINSTNRGVFFAPHRRGPAFDFLRTDLGILLHDGIPMTTSVSGLFATGVNPDEPFSYEAHGPRLSKLTEQVGRTFASLGATQRHSGPAPFDPSRFTWRDADSASLSDAVFEGVFNSSMTLAMMTLQGAARTANHLSRSECCTQCAAAALKHRYVVAYQALVSLRLLRPNTMLPASAQARIDAILDTPESAHMMTDEYRRLRNGWLHLGLTDVPHDDDEDALSLERTVDHYTRGESIAEVASVTDVALNAVASALDEWCMSPKTASMPLSSILQVP
ncbi:hypothetical protein [Isoptericola sp. NPDC056134]|uniref:hypothetical protein n=1 Tax=Isoptericola sp. NPDC056134 TaxID=3345723 RepID=UPI0035E567B9